LFVEFIGALKYAFASTLVTMILLWCLERVAPRSPVTWASQLRSLGYWLFYLVAGAAITVAFTRGLKAAGIHTLYTFPLSSWIRGAPIYILGPLVGMLVYDFFNYWMHRAQHKWFWRQHSVHHSIEQLSAINSYFHPTEDLFRIAFISLPLTLVGVATGPTTFAAVIIVGAWGNYLHTASRANLGRVGRWFLADNVYHRVHHSREERHFDVNFATATPIWDVLFGTVYWPAKDEWPATGVWDYREPRSVRSFLCDPFRRSADFERLQNAGPGFGAGAEDPEAHFVDRRDVA
jgi:sterol desaturase/sphingolipid hydroxylase (fatty acid hydroxylase superfamily)